MSLTRVFLGWDGPLAQRVAEYLVPAPDHGPADFTGVLVVVPTRQAGRHLRVALARRAKALLGHTIVPPVVLFHGFEEHPGAATPAQALAAWTKVLREVSAADCAAFLPRLPEPRTFEWALSIAKPLQQLRAELAEGGWSIESVSEGVADLAEPERWQAMANLERLYLSELAHADRLDVQSLRLQRAAQPALPAGFRRVVVAAVPDPAPLAVKALEAIVTSGHVAVEVLVQAPAALADAFDAWGRPSPASWKASAISESCAEATNQSSVGRGFQGTSVAQASSPASSGGVPPPAHEHAPGRCLNSQPRTAALHGDGGSAIQETSEAHWGVPPDTAPHVVGRGSCRGLESTGQNGGLGRSLAPPGPWSDRQIEIPAEEKNLFLEANPEAIATRIIRILKAESDRFPLSAVAVGVAEVEVIPALATLLARDGVQAFDPRETPFLHTALGHLVDGLLEFQSTGTYRSVSQLLRHPAALLALAGRRGDANAADDAAAILGALDELQNEHLPLRLDDLWSWLTGEWESLTSRQRLLRPAMERLLDWRRKLNSGDLPQALREVISSIYGPNVLGPTTDDPLLLPAAGLLGDTLVELADAARLWPMEAGGEVALLRECLRGLSCPTERRDEPFDLEGWLELSWNDRALLVVAGMNEGLVPDSILADPFLPNSLRARLGLRDDATRLARDAYILTSLIESRRGNGRVVLLAGKTDTAGDPLKPSRLLFRCADDALVQRAQRLFQITEAANPVARAESGFKLEPGRLDVAKLDRLSATALADYLHCPFRFYLKHRLRMERLSDQMREPDASAFGTLVHDVLKTLGEDRSLWASDDADRLARLLGELVEQRFASQYGARPALPVRLALLSAKARLTGLARLQVRLATEGWEILAVEKEGQLPVNDLPIRCRIDRVDRHRETGRLRVLDYKTFDNAKAPEETHLGTPREFRDYAKVEIAKKNKPTTRNWVNLQLPIYREILAREHIGVPADVGYIVLTKGIESIEALLWTGYDDELHAAAMKCLHEVVRRIQAGLFWPPGEVPEWEDEFADLFPLSAEQCIDPAGLLGQPAIAEAPHA